MNLKKVRLAILDMNNGAPNRGLNCIKEIVKGYNDQIDWKVFDVRQKHELPDLSYDIYISSGGPGSPHEEGAWRAPYLQLIDRIWAYNLEDHPGKKYIFFICYSFQIACVHFKLGKVNQRISTSFGVFPVHKTQAGMTDPILKDLNNPYYAVDSRDWQLVQPRLKVFENKGAKILSLEKMRTHAEYERAIMAVRFSDECVGTQFHPEADPEGMKEYFALPKHKDIVIRNFDEERYQDMMKHLEDSDNIERTHQTIIPSFIENSLEKIHQQSLLLT